MKELNDMKNNLFRQGEVRKKFRSMLAVTLAAASVFTLLSGCSVSLPKPSQAAVTVPTTETVPTEPPATVPADGDPQNVTCKGSYTDDNVMGRNVVAEIEDQTLNNNQLNILYRLAVNGYQPEEGQPEPDFSKPLDTQLCPLDGDHITWQQYFLQQALDFWQAVQTLECRSHMKVVNTEPFFEPSPERHETYMSDVPVNDTVLYNADASYKVHKKDKAYLEALPETMKAMAKAKGYGSLKEFLDAEFGSTVTEGDFDKITYLINYAYLYFISQSYEKPKEEQLSLQMAKIHENREPIVDFRHILIYSNEASVGVDGKLQADEDVWEDSYRLAQEALRKFEKSKTKDDAAFSTVAHDYTRDTDSMRTGGLYAGVRRGQVIEPLNQWLFAPERQPGDTEIIRSDYGWHVLYLKDRKDGRYPYAEYEVKAHNMRLIMEEAAHNYPMNVDYEKIQLSPMEDHRGTVTLGEDILYGDKGHERFPEVPVYIQQDYPRAYYGNYKLTTHGCGISAFAMLSTYMADELLTPAILAAQYGRYNGLHGTDWKLFTEVPPILGYHLSARSGLWADVAEGMREGKMAISLQVKGYFTRAGHYLVLSELLDDDQVVIRDSNLYNYTRLKEHKQDHFSYKRLLPNNQGFWIYDQKVVTVPNCSRCGENHRDGKPGLFPQNDYICHKCMPAMERRAAFLDLCGMN